MSAVSLTIGLTLPWLSGIALLSALGARHLHSKGHYPLLLGEGFLVGQLLAAGSLLLIDNLGQKLDFLLVCTLLTGLLGVGILWRWRQHSGRPKAQGHSRPPEISGTGLLLVLLLLAAIGLHLVLSLGEILWRPLYPWDAWTTWAARAKVWYLEQQLTPFVAADQWLHAGGNELRTIAAYDYPELVSLVMLWIAMAADGWTEPLLGLPWLQLAMALLLLIYGHARQAGMNALQALLACYLMISLPLLHSHVSLAGYADLWQSAFSCALLLVVWHTASGNRTPLPSLLLLAGGGLWVKQEGLLWLLLAAVCWLLIRFGRSAWLLLGSLVLMLALGVWLGMDLSLDLGSAGRLGLREGLLWLPGLGGRELGYNPLAKELIASLFGLASWHLLFYALLLAVLLLLLQPTRRRALPGTLLLLAAPLLAVSAIFLFTAEGRWASDFTAASRLYLQFAPLWTLLVVRTLLAPAPDRETP